MVKIGHPSMSEAFEPPPLGWGYWEGRFPATSELDIFEEYFRGDWRLGQAMSKIVITQRFYQISPNSTQAWFWKSNFKIKKGQKFKFSIKSKH